METLANCMKKYTSPSLIKKNTDFQKAEIVFPVNTKAWWSAAEERDNQREARSTKDRAERAKWHAFVHWSH